MASDALADRAAGDHYLLLHTGGLGDLILLAHLVVALKKAAPDALLTVACRAQFAELLRCYPVPPDRVLGLSFNPYQWSEPGPSLFAELRAVYHQLAAERVTTFIAAGLRLTWFDWFIAAALQPERTVCCSDVPKPQGLLPLVLRHFGVGAPHFEGPQAEASLSEGQRYEKILHYLGVPPADPFPWTLDDGIRKQAEQRLSSLGLRRGRYLTCCPVGSGAVALKRWPQERFRLALTRVREEFDLEILIVGSRREEPELRAFAASVPGCAVFAGGDDELPLLLGLVADSRAYLGNDTGPAHVAAAYRVPGVVVFGGGHWPAYRTWSQGSIAIVRPLPCFGCDWDCVFGEAFCVTGIPVEAVMNALQEVLERPPEQPQVRVVPGVRDEVEELIAAASARYRVTQRDRHERLNSILALQADAARFREETARREQELSDVIRTLEQAAAERLAALQQTAQALEEERRHAAQREQEMSDVIRTLEQAAAERLAALEQTTQALEEERRRAAQREQEMSDVIRTLEQAAAERLAALEQTTQALEEERRRAAQREQELSSVIRTLEQAAAERLAALEQTTQALETTRAELGAVRSELTTLRQESLLRYMVRRLREWRRART